MIGLGRVRRIFASGMRSLSVRRRRKALIPVEGVPEGIAFETLNELCLCHLGKPLVHVSHVHISGWKAAGAYRLFLRTGGGRHWSLIYKNAIYSVDHIPALAELPVIPGPPEYLVYSNAQGTLARYLPTVYFCLEVTPGEHYQYLLEDLGQEYQRVSKPEAFLGVVAALPAIHCALSEWSLTVDQDRLLHYGPEFSMTLQKHASKILERYARRMANTAVSEVCRLWPRISEVHRRQEFHESKTVHPIHGDFNCANIRIHQQHPDRIKLLDWEWAGLGMAHVDLASLVKGRVSVEQQALAVFSGQDRRLSPGEHKRLYQWCLLERGILDGAFCAAQLMALPNLPTSFSLSRFIEHSMRQVLSIYQELA